MEISTNSTNSGTQTINVRQVYAKNVVDFALKVRGWTEKKLAQKMKVSQSYISNLRKRNWDKIGLRVQYNVAKASGLEMELPKFGFMK